MAEDNDKSIIDLANDRFAAATKAWAPLREQWRNDHRFAFVTGGQWKTEFAEKRRQNGKPVLEFNELFPAVTKVVNKARQMRPEPHISPSDDIATKETAEFMEDRLRHFHRVSQADAVYDIAVQSQVGGGFGFIAIDTEYVSDDKDDPKFWNQEPRICPVFDAMTETPDPIVILQLDQDPMYWFSEQWLKRSEYKRRFKKDPIPFDSEQAPPGWVEIDDVRIAEYYTVDIKRRKVLGVQTQDGALGNFYADELAEMFGMSEEQLPAAGFTVVNERDEETRKITKYLIDGARVLKRTELSGHYIPKIFVPGLQAIVDGQPILISTHRFAMGSQELVNAYRSNIANHLGTTGTSPYVGVAGSFDNPAWTQQYEKNLAFLEWKPITLPNGQLAPPPRREPFEPPIQALAMAAMQEADATRRLTGYTDSLLTPSREQLSGVALDKREGQSDLANFHFIDNLARSFKYMVKVLIDLDFALADTPRTMTGIRPDGKTKVIRPVSPKEGGEVAGHEGKPHIQFGQGAFDVAVTTGPGYLSRREEELKMLVGMVNANPAMWAVYGDIIFDLMSLPELAERAKLALLPQVQQAIQAQAQAGQITPQQLQQMIAENQQLKQVVQSLAEKLKADSIKEENKLHIARMGDVKDIVIQQMKNDHDAVKTLHGTHTDAIAQAAEQEMQRELSQQQAEQAAQQQDKALAAQQAAQKQQEPKQ